VKLPVRVLKRQTQAQTVEFAFKDPVSAYKASIYPGMKTGEPQTVIYETGDYFEVMRMLLFVI